MDECLSSTRRECRSARQQTPNDADLMQLVECRHQSDAPAASAGLLQFFLAMATKSATTAEHTSPTVVPYVSHTLSNAYRKQHCGVVSQPLSSNNIDLRFSVDANERRQEDSIINENGKLLHYVSHIRLSHRKIAGRSWEIYELLMGQMFVGLSKT